MSSEVTEAKSESARADSLASRLAEEMAAAWRRGERPQAEEFLARHAELGEHPGAAVRLIYEEICLSQEFGLAVDSQEVVRRFPHWRAELDVLLDCHRLLQPAAAFPAAGEALGDFRLLAELGRGARGRVFLAAQPSLADRPVVLKITPAEDREHLSLARLQHTHIVPLYAVQDFSERGLRALCMPYLGSATLARIVKWLREHVVGERSGQDLIRALEDAQTGRPDIRAIQAPARLFLARASYVQAVCWIGACLADALHYAHERGLVHLDLKPSNVLLALDGQPMLLDFHLARPPLQPGGPPPEWLGGTPDYMSPEQRAALAAVREGRPVPAAVDGRSDIYSLGLLLYEVLGGVLAADPAAATPPRLERWNPEVGTGISDLIQKCLAFEARARYPDAAALAADLRRHLTDQLLRGVANRSVRERWQKWRRRRPHALTQLLMVLAIVAAVSTTGAIVLGRKVGRMREAAALLDASQKRFKDARYSESLDVCRRGLAIVREIPGNHELKQTLERQCRLAKRAEAVEELHGVAEKVRFLYSIDSLPSSQMRGLEPLCHALWDVRGKLLNPGGEDLGPEREQRIRTDLLDLALLWAELRVRLAGEADVQQARRDALEVLAEAEATFGPSPVLYTQRRAYAEALGLTELARAAARRAAGLPPRTDWDHYALGRSLLSVNDLERAAAELARAVELRPQGFWPNFYQGVAAYRLRRFDDAVNAFRVCVALAPEQAECFHNRAMAEAARGDTRQALHDYGRALELDPTLAAAALNRGVLAYRQGLYPDAVVDLRRALDAGGDPGNIHYNLALVHLAQRHRAAALASLEAVLRSRPADQQARALYDRLRRER